jgi:hypothetical protein
VIGVKPEEKPAPIFAYKAECGGRDRFRSQARGEKAKATRPDAAEANQVHPPT